MSTEDRGMKRSGRAAAGIMLRAVAPRAEQGQQILDVDPLVGHDVVLGLRPETLSDRPDGPNAEPENTIDAVVSVVEPLGDRMDVHLETPMESGLVCRLDARRPLGPGDRVRMHVDMGRAHVFEPGGCGVNLALTHRQEQASE